MTAEIAARPIRFVHRGAVVQVDHAAPTRTALDWLREDAHCTGTKEGCNEGDCGACTVVVGALDAAAPAGVRLDTVNACLLFVPALDGRAIVTVEDLKPMSGGALHPVQQALVDCHGSQCGFCTPGFVMSLWATYESHRTAGTRPTRQQLADDLAGNLCRCTGYRPILDAGQRMFDLPAVPFDAAALRAALQALQRRDDAGVAANAGANGPGATFRYAPASHADAFFAPTTLEELAALRLQHPEARLLAGATDVGLWVNKQFRPLGDILSIGRVDELAWIGVRRIGRGDMADDSGGEELVIGAGASLEAAWTALVARCPPLADMWLRFASPPIRHAGTMGGSVANGSPIGDAAPVLIALDAEIELRRGTETRRLPLADFYVGYMQNQLQRGEFVQAIAVPLAAFERQVRAYKISKRFDSDITAVCAALAIDLDAAGTVRAVRLAFGGMAAVVKRAAGAEAALVGRPWSLEQVQKAQAALAGDFQPLSDLRASAAYRLQVAQNLLRRFWLETRTDAPLSSDATSVWSVMPHALPVPARLGAGA